MSNRFNLLFLVIFFSSFVALAHWQSITPTKIKKIASSEDRIVISAPILTFLFGGDRHLASNLESIRLAATGLSDTHEADLDYLLRAHLVAAKLNPCQEDNYYLANAFLAWGGATEKANEVLKLAMECRHWDEVPAFFYGFNQFFFMRDIQEAQRAFEMAAQRSPESAAAFRKLAIMIEVETIQDERLALEQLEHERSITNDPKLMSMLDRRIERIRGLITLRDAQRRYEAKTGTRLPSAQTLLDKNYLEAFPVDPMRIGYEFKDGEFTLRQIHIKGEENNR